MRTLLENITFVKGVEYLIIVAFCLGFIALWIMVHTKERETMRRLVPLIIPLSLIFGVAAVGIATYFNPDATAILAVQESTVPEYYSNGSPATNIAYNPDKWLKVNNSEYLAITYGPATKFHQIMSTKVSCETCHHNSGDKILACKDCHDRPFNPGNSSKPGLKAAYHQRCMSCHKDAFNGPNSCTFCHSQGTLARENITATARPHQLTWENCSRCHKDGIPGGGQQMKIVYHDNCLKCHTKGIAGAAPVPGDHAGRAVNTCSGCHKPVEG